MDGVNLFRVQVIPSPIKKFRDLFKNFKGIILAKVQDFENEHKIRIMFQNEERFGRVSLPRSSWAPQEMRPVCHTQIVRKYTYAYSAISPVDGVIESFIAPVATTEVMEIFLQQVSSRFPDENVIMIMDKAAWHTTGKLSLPKNIALCFRLHTARSSIRLKICGKRFGRTILPIGFFEI
ncbi:MAG: hypothetical protein BWY31_00921 [Lentisphaerae bacterium ADurb.Bin242]|nr:MAG: hypothetical protein BWY31_00921 [Lentisphaerae bacterium ADurb.Bin242]